MKADIYKQTEFIKDCLRKGEKRIDILAKFNKKYQNKNTRVFDARLKIAGEAIQKEFDYIASKEDDDRFKHITAAALLTLQGRADKKGGE